MPNGSSGLFYRENDAGAPEGRIRQVRREIEATGTYRHTSTELEFGARVAWRNSAKCIGRLLLAQPAGA